MRVLVCGGREYDTEEDRRHVFEILDQVHRSAAPITVVITGGARGIDTWGALWAFERRIDQDNYRADWTAHGKAAGPIRNQEMLTKGRPQLVVAFPGGPGTADMVRRARKAGVRVMEVPARERKAA